MIPINQDKYNIYKSIYHNTVSYRMKQYIYIVQIINNICILLLENYNNIKKYFLLILHYAGNLGFYLLSVIHCVIFLYDSSKVNYYKIL